MVETTRIELVSMVLQTTAMTHTSSVSIDVKIFWLEAEGSNLHTAFADCTILTESPLTN